MHCAGEKLRVIFALIFEKEVIDTSFRSNFRRQYLKQHAFFSRFWRLTEVRSKSTSRILFHTVHVFGDKVYILAHTL